MKTLWYSQKSFLDLYDQYKTMEIDGKWRFTSPTHTVIAFAKAIDEMKAEGGISARNKRYTENNRLLISKMAEMGFDTYIDHSVQGPIITTFLFLKMLITLLLICIHTLRKEDMLFTQVR